MSDWINTLPDAAQAYIKGQRLDEVECIISDLPGIARGKAVPSNRIGSMVAAAADMGPHKQTASKVARRTALSSRG